MKSIRYTAAVCAALSFTLPAAAQVIRGRVIDNTTFMGVVGAGVTALDSAGKPVASVLTDSSGAFALRLPAHVRPLALMPVGAPQ